MIFPVGVSAKDISVNISNSVESNSNISINSSSGDGTKNDVRIEVNGEVKEFHTDGKEEINWKSEDGNLQLQIFQNKDLQDLEIFPVAGEEKEQNTKPDSPGISSVKTIITFIYSVFEKRLYPSFGRNIYWP